MPASRGIRANLQGIEPNSTAYGTALWKSANMPEERTIGRMILNLLDENGADRRVKPASVDWKITDDPTYVNTIATIFQ